MLNIIIITATILGGIAAIWFFWDKIKKIPLWYKKRKEKDYTLTYVEDPDFKNPRLMEQIIGENNKGANVVFEGSIAERVKKLPSKYVSKTPRFKYIMNVLDCRYRYEQLKRSSNKSQLRLLNLDIDDTKCFWRRVPDRIDEIENLSHLSGIKMTDSQKKQLIDMVRERTQFRQLSDFDRSLYKEAQYSFHQSNVGKNREKRIPDPVLDLTFANIGKEPLLIKRISVAPLASWSKPKAVPVPQVVHIFKAYFIPVDFSKMLCSAKLRNPIYLSKETPIRMHICLPKYSGSLSVHGGNESLIAIVVHFNGTHFITPPIYLGVLS